MARGHPAGRTMGGSQGCRDHPDPLYIYIPTIQEHEIFPIPLELPPPSLMLQIFLV